MAKNIKLIVVGSPSEVVKEPSLDIDKKDDNLEQASHEETKVVKEQVVGGGGIKVVRKKKEEINVDEADEVADSRKTPSNH